VLSGPENAKLTALFREKCARPDAARTAEARIRAGPEETLGAIHAASPACKRAALAAYRDFTGLTAADTENPAEQAAFFDRLREACRKRNLVILCDMNGSARSLSIDRAYFESLGCDFRGFNDSPGKIAHGIIPEGDNLAPLAAALEKAAADTPAALLGYMPDCDGDRGNLAYYDPRTCRAELIGPQEGFALGVFAELSWLAAHPGSSAGRPLAVVVNGPTSLRIDEIAARFNARVFRAEVGEANVVNLARLKRDQGFIVRVLGEGSNGGIITHPSAVRDPLQTLTALLKLLSLRPGESVGDILASLPAYTTTGVTEERALLTIKSTDHAVLKRNFQKEFEAWWAAQKDALAASRGIASYTAIATQGAAETLGIADYGVSGAGGLKILFYDAAGKPLAFMWMRGSGTEPVFRVLCDVRGDNPQFEAALLEAETRLIKNADMR
jgi:phosphoglucomutase